MYTHITISILIHNNLIEIDNKLINVIYLYLMRLLCFAASILILNKLNVCLFLNNKNNKNSINNISASFKIIII